MTGGSEAPRALPISQASSATTDAKTTIMKMKKQPMRHMNLPRM